MHHCAGDAALHPAAGLICDGPKGAGRQTESLSVQRRSCSRSAEPFARRREGEAVGQQDIVDGVIRGACVIVPLELVIKPTGQIAQGIGDDGFGVRRYVLSGGDIARDRDGHAVFVAAPPMLADIRPKLVEAPPLDVLQHIGDAVQPGVLRGIGADPNAAPRR